MSGAPCAQNAAAMPGKEESKLLNFEKGRIIVRRWKILERLGAGGCGAVFKVESLQRKGYIAALKVERRSEEEHGMLKLEVATLRQLNNCNHVIRLIDSGCRENYNYMVMTLCGYDLMSLKRQSKEGFSENTLIRIGIHTLYAIKQVHEMGFIHRDVKPGNMMNGAVGREQRMFFLIDYGMARSFVIKKQNKVTIRPPRTGVLLRGTLRYCSLAVHERKEQGRVDDLWAMLYMLVELYIGLPWHIKNEKEIIKLKKTTKDSEVFNECPPEFIQMAVYLRTLNYESRPDYYKLYEMLVATMRRENYSFLDKYDWEENKGEPEPETYTALEYSIREKANLASLDFKEIEYKLYPCADPNVFKAQVLPI